MEIRIREANPADAGPMARVHVEPWRTAYAGILPAGHLALAWVLQDNHPACRFYESLGAERIGQKAVAIGGTDLVEVSCGWSDITSLEAGG